MIFKEEKGDLFANDILAEYALCHCISSDFALGAGIAKEFAKMGVKKELCEKFSKQWQGRGYCLISETNGVFVGNLVTKERYFHKPTIETLRQSLEDFREQAVKLKLQKIAMPKIGCGLDKLNWENVREVIKEVFAETEIELNVKFL